MANCEVNITNSDPKVIAKELRTLTRFYDPSGEMLRRVSTFLLGAACVAAMDYGDVWICVGSCNQ